MNETNSDQKKLVIIGAGPAGLTAALGLSDHGLGPKTVVLEGDSVVGGISRTVERDGWRFDIGGHRFFTKVKEVDDLWHRILPPEDFLMRPRMSRIFYKGKYYDYPLKAMNALRNLGVLEAIRCVLSYAWVRIRPPKDQSTFEGWTASRFGWRLYFIFFKTYTEKVWGVPANEIQADWAAQRIKNLSLGNAIINSILPKRNQKEITSLIEEFQYPKFGPGMMWERCAELVTAKGVQIEMSAPVIQINRDSSGVCSVIIQMRSGEQKEVPTESLISSMPINQLVQVMEPPAPLSVLKAAQDLKHRDFLTVALVVPEKFAFPDNWIYIHSPEARVGRIQNFGSWSPFLIKEGRTCLGLEYFVSIGDDLWEMDDEKLIALGSAELEKLGIITSPEVIEVGYVVRMPRAYPVYDKAYQENIEIIKDWIALETPNVYPVGRNGMHKYNNQDHSMMTAILSVENIAAGASHDIWSVNVEEEYHETGSSAGTGRSAPVIG